MSEAQASLLLKKQLKGKTLIQRPDRRPHPFGALILRIDLNGCDLTDLQKNPVEGFSAGLANDDDIYCWEVLIIGPPDTL